MLNVFKNNKGGTIILLTILILSSVLVATLTIGDIVRSGLIMGRIQVHSTKAYFAAEAGAEKVLWEIRKNGLDPVALGCDQFGDEFCFDNDPDGNINECKSGGACSVTDTQTLSNNAVFNLTYGYDPVSGTTTIVSYGSYKNVRRAVEIKY